MKKILSAVLLAAISISAFAQQDAVEKDGVIYSNADAVTEFSGRVGAAAEFQLAKGLELAIGEEIRLGYNPTAATQGLDRMYTSIGLSYRVNEYLKFGLGYDFINVWKEVYVPESEDSDVEVFAGEEWDFRHRASFDITGTYKIGGFKLSLRERIQATYKAREDFNYFQQPRVGLDLRSRFKASYSCRTVPLVPFVSVELKNCLNDVDLAKSSFVKDKDKDMASGYKTICTSVKYGHAYVNRIRGEIGTDWLINSHNIFTFYLMYDYGYNEKIDMGRYRTDFRTEDGIISGRKFKSLTGVTTNTISLGVTYTFGL